jgi:hypothetical protein
MLKYLATFGAALIVGSCPCSYASAADLYNPEVTELKAPDCVTDASQSFFAENVQLAEPPHPTLPVHRFYLIVRYLGDESILAAPAFDFSRFPEDYAWPPYRGMALTDLNLPEPKAAWQRARRTDATMDNSSAFQLHCYDAASFINTWTFPDVSISGGGPHSIYGYSFDDPATPAIYDANPATDFVLQASIEIPWFARWLDPVAPAGVEPIGQVNLFAYFRDRYSGKTFAMLLAVFDNRNAADPTYPSFVAHDGATPFVSMPLNASGKYATPSPYSSAYTGVPWTGLRFFRGQVTQDNFRHALSDVNTYCHSHSTLRYCGLALFRDTAYSEAVTDYEITDFGVIHEIDRGGPNGQLSMAVHVYGLGAWNFR